jgi:polysaccharide export outer membrane protein
VGACAGPGQYVWIQDLPPQASDEKELVIEDGETLDIRVFGQEAMSTHARVRPDGRIAMPVVGDVVVRGKRPKDLKAELEARLKDYVNTPSVTVTVVEFRSFNVAVLGEFGHSGVFPIDRHTRLSDVLALAGGLTDFASRDRLFVVRPATPTPLRVRFTYEDVARGNPRVAAFVLQPGDLIVAE